MATVSKDQNTLGAVGPAAHVAEVVYHGDKLIIPVGMTLLDARKLIKRREDYLEEVMAMNETFNVFPWDGANAIEYVLTDKFGWAQATATPGFFGPTPPKMIKIDIGPNQTKQVPWGRFSLPSVDGYIECDVSRVEGRFMFALSAEVKRKDEETIKDVFARVREFIKENSIYRGKAIKMRFLSDDGKPLPMPIPSFMDTSKISRDMLIYSQEVMDAVETNLFTPIERVQDCIDNGLPVKRSVLLGGTYGVGKTLAATVASKIAVDHGITYLYVPRADELAQAIAFAKQYQSPACVIFCEDIDRALAGERTVEMDDILNIVDGIDTKTTNVVMVLTTNDLEALNPAMLRPGRLDAVIEVTPPDAKAVEKLLRYYGGDAIEADADLTMAGKAMDGKIPAVIAEVIKRAKLSQLRLQMPGTKVTQLSEDAIIQSSVQMKNQLDLLERRTAAQNPVVPALDTVFTNMVSAAVKKAMDEAETADDE